jgi:predicted AAA+ superfamily ATPase
MFYKRDILSKLEQELTAKEVTVVTGMRQVGKTTILKHIFEKIESDNKVLLDLESPLNRKIFEEQNYDAVWNNLNQFGIRNTEKAYIFLDEIQNLPKISSVVKYLYDHWEVKFFLTGSSSS